MVNISLKLEDGSFGAIEMLTLMPDDVFYSNNKKLGEYGSPEFMEYINKFIPKENPLLNKPAPQNEEELFQQVSEIYADTKSIKKTAKVMGMSEERARRILFTVGAYTCETHEKVMALMKEGVSLSDTAKQIGMSLDQVRRYLPYGRTTYGAVLVQGGDGAV